MLRQCRLCLKLVDGGDWKNTGSHEIMEGYARIRACEIYQTLISLDGTRINCASVAIFPPMGRLSGTVTPLHGKFQIFLAIIGSVVALSN